MAIRETPSEPLVALTNADRMRMPVPHGPGKSSGASPRSGLLCAAFSIAGHTTMPRAKMSSSQAAGNVRSAAVQFSCDFARRQWIGGGPARVPSGPDEKPAREPGAIGRNWRLYWTTLHKAQRMALFHFCLGQVSGAPIRCCELQLGSQIRSEEKKGLKRGVREHSCVSVDTARTT
jgi:hypothetical protein